MKRVLAISDIHCGSVVGLTPPSWQIKPKKSGGTKWDKFSKIQGELWNKFEKILKKHAPYDVVLFGGDAIDGKGKRSGGTEQITSSLEEQADMAVRVFDTIRLHGKKRKSMKMFSVYGTKYHVSGEDGEDWENIIAKDAGMEKIGGHEWVDVDGVVFDMKHKISGSTIPHGRFTATARDLLWNELWAMEDLQPLSDVLLRGHVHYHIGLWQVIRHKVRWAMTLPALQGMGSKYGAREMSGLIHWGAVVFECEKGTVDFTSEIVEIEGHRAEAVKV